MTGAGPILVATSIPPLLARQNQGRPIAEAYQKLCIQSWIECGFRIISVNDRDEIPDLQRRFEEVRFVATDRNASAISGRKTPFIADLFAALAASSDAEVLGIVNSDIVFEPGTLWKTQLPKIASRAVVTGQRYDTKSLRGGMLNKYRAGFDYFFFDRSALDEIQDDELTFAMGLAWWDYWLPITLALGGRPILHIDRPATIHLYHGDMAFPPELRGTWRLLARKFAETTLRKSETANDAMAAKFASLFPLCREIAAPSNGAALESGKLDDRITDLAARCVDAARADAIRLDEDHDAQRPTPVETETTLMPATIFRNFEKRVSAAATVGKAAELEWQGKFDAAEPAYLLALEQAPNDGDILFCAGNFFLARRKFAFAVDLLERAANETPGSHTVLHTLGCALAAVGRRSEAIASFEKALKISPEYAPARDSLAQALHRRPLAP